jgi:hypothetical protein
MNKFLSKNVLILYTLIGLCQNCHLSTYLYIHHLLKAVPLLGPRRPLFFEPVTPLLVHYGIKKSL